MHHGWDKHNKKAPNTISSLASQNLPFSTFPQQPKKKKKEKKKLRVATWF